VARGSPIGGDPSLRPFYSRLRADVSPRREPAGSTPRSLMAPRQPTRRGSPFDALALDPQTPRLGQAGAKRPAQGRARLCHAEDVNEGIRPPSRSPGASRRPRHTQANVENSTDGALTARPLEPRRRSSGVTRKCSPPGAAPSIRRQLHLPHPTTRLCR
jgi:hypothetical protein